MKVNPLCQSAERDRRNTENAGFGAGSGDHLMPTYIICLAKIPLAIAIMSDFGHAGFVGIQGV